MQRRREVVMRGVYKRYGEGKFRDMESINAVMGMEIERLKGQEIK